MIFTQYDDAERLLERVEPMLLAKEAFNGMLLGTLYGLRRNPNQIAKPLLATVQAGERLALVAVQTAPKRLLLASELDEPAEAVGRLVHNLPAYHVVERVNGPTHITLPFGRLWSAERNVSASIFLDQFVYDLHEVTFPQHVSGRARLADAADAEVITEWAADFSFEALGERFAGPAVKAAMQDRIKHGYVMLWEDEGAVVSMAQLTRQLRDGITISLVYTPPHLRGHGYASAVTAAVSQRGLDLGWQFCTLFTDATNAVANKIYQRIGYRKLGSYLAYNFEV